MIIVYPKEGQHRVKHDLLWRVKSFVGIPNFNGKKAAFWHAVTILKIIILCSETIYTYKNLDNPNIFIMVATYPLRIMGVWKLLHLSFDIKRVNRLFTAVHEEFWAFDVAGAELESKIKRKMLHTTVFVYVHSSLSLICVTFFAFNFMSQTPKGKRPLPNLVWTPFDTDPSPLHEIVFVVLLWNLYLTVLSNIFYDMMFVYCSRHLSVQFMLLKELLKNITVRILEEKSDVERFNSEYFQRSVMDRLKICASHHNKLLKQILLFPWRPNLMVDIPVDLDEIKRNHDISSEVNLFVILQYVRYGREIEEFCKSVLAPQLFISFAILVINGYNLTVDHTDISRTIMLSNITGSSLVQLAVYALQATDLREQSLSILNSVIECKWYLFRAPLKKALVFMLMNSEKGIVITAAGMITIDNPLLVDVVQKAFSSITLLQAFVNEDTQ
ncbi:hypothetical protein NQ318_001480 [Aromia moschata]|uniref:Odorant receptor n=1 Tax=Aromia moschata TaxID=1265417 RepID=A0AAV8X925_9CUCU|nr:hypothetical protein NQ318_001480 [Aromia moschata]